MNDTTEPTAESLHPVVEVFWRPGCPFCSALRTDLERRGIVAQWRNIWEDQDARALVRETNDGNETVPTVFVGSLRLTNPSGHEVAEALLGRHGTVARRRRLSGVLRRGARAGSSEATPGDARGDLLGSAGPRVRPRG